VIGFEHVRQEPEGKVRADGWQPEVVRIEDGLLAATRSHVDQGGKRDAPT
jgi:hypothetical protein